MFTLFSNHSCDYIHADIRNIIMAILDWCVFVGSAALFFLFLVCSYFVAT